MQLKLLLPVKVNFRQDFVNIMEAPTEFTCMRDNEKFNSIEALHSHLRKLKITQAAYYLYYYPRVDLLTGAKIEFKSYSQYFSTYFANKNNLKKYCVTYPDKGLQFGIDFLKARAARKGIKRAFHQVELKSLACPTVSFFNAVDDYGEICRGLGLETPFSYAKELRFEYPSLTGAVVNFDTREQVIIKFSKVAAELKTLHYGDYSINAPYDSGIYIEKKSLSDMVGSFGKDYQRLRREFIRCKEAGHYIVVLVLSPFSKAIGFNYQFETRYAKVSPDYVFGNVRDIINEFDNVQFLFIDKERAEDVLLKIFQMGKNVKTCDLQYLNDLKLL